MSEVVVDWRIDRLPNEVTFAIARRCNSTRYLEDASNGISTGRTNDLSDILDLLRSSSCLGHLGKHMSNGWDARDDATVDERRPAAERYPSTSWCSAHSLFNFVHWSVDRWTMTTTIASVSDVTQNKSSIRRHPQWRRDQWMVATTLVIFSYFAVAKTSAGTLRLITTAGVDVKARFQSCIQLSYPQRRLSTVWYLAGECLMQELAEPGVLCSTT